VRHWAGMVCIVSMVAAPSARADMMPARDRGPPSGSAGGLHFSIQPAREKMPTGYYKSVSVVILDGCTTGQPNCILARSKNLVGMEVESVDGQYLRPENGMVREILDAFASKAGPATVTLALRSAAPDSGTIQVAFARR